MDVKRRLAHPADALTSGARHITVLIEGSILEAAPSISAAG